jgi:hypothetical protein
MNVAQFQSLLETANGKASFITLTTLTEPDWKALKDTAGVNPHKGLVKKRTKINGVFNWSYEAAVNRQRVREGTTPDFESLPRKWGTRVHGTPWVEHKGKIYLELKCQNVYEVEYVDDNLNVVHDGVKEYVKPKASQPRQGLENETILRDYTVTNILSFTWNGNFYTIDEEVRLAA